MSPTSIEITKVPINDSPKYSPLQNTSKIPLRNIVSLPHMLMNIRKDHRALKRLLIVNDKIHLLDNKELIVHSISRAPFILSLQEILTVNMNLMK